MPDIDPKKYVIIHGHFYQPPRENPWTGKIDRQDSAAPYHDWNERILRECYLPNARSRRLDGFGRVTRLVNNYEAISFNFGPTLFSWIEKEHPGLHDELVRADKVSLEKLGHGNAIAQVYNHIIMPLANRRDQETQIRWGVHDFRRRFGREPEGIWLAETAINEITLELLIEFGFRFVILSPFQAERMRPIDKSSKWKDVSSGDILTGRAYRCFGRKKKGKRILSRFIDIFFYDAPLSTDISFNQLLSNGDKLAEALESGFERCGGDLINIATDGEVYGHHEPFGDMALAYLIDQAAPDRGLTLTNYGAFLDEHELKYEVQIKQGEGGEGTAWSCFHSVGRWKEDCGCSTGAPPGWNQKWRTPLRDGLDILRDGLAAIYETKAKDIFESPWKTRDEYIKSFDDLDTAESKSFIEKQAGRKLSPEEMSTAASLLESQRNSLLMFTSCGWFFNDISGIETVQDLKYAARAIDMAERAEKATQAETDTLAATDINPISTLQNDFLEILAGARSNIAEQGTGRDIFNAARKYSSVEPSLLAGQYALASNLDCRAASPERYGFEFDDTGRVEISPGSTSMIIGRFTMADPLTLASYDYKYLLLPDEPARITCLLSECSGNDDYTKTRDRFKAIDSESSRQDIIRAAVEHFGGRIFAMRDLFPEDKEKILDKLAERQIASIMGQFTELYMENRELLRLFTETSMRPPESLLVQARTVLADRLKSEMAHWERALDDKGLKGVHDVLSEAKYYGVDIDRTEIASIFEGFFLESLGKLREGLNSDLADKLHVFAEYSYGIGIPIIQHEIQNELFFIMTTVMEEALVRIGKGKGFSSDVSSVSSFLRLARRFNFNTDSWRQRLPANANDSD
ncbi:MAG: DUF3536 domain-containing protein [Candidatus Krumholzibacteria bacterium]|nr:DUF3536 domain-containing protein [Candidatus Krumholzibacteria bacterium]